MSIDPSPSVCQHCGGDVIFGRPTDRDYRDFYHARSGTAECPPPVNLSAFHVVPNGDMDDPPALMCRMCEHPVRRLPTSSAGVISLAELVAEATQHQDHHCTYVRS